MRRAILCGAIGGVAAAAVFLAAGCAEMSAYARAPVGALDYARDPDPLFPVPSLIKIDPPEPELAPSRKISEQDCSKPVDLTAGNLRCK